MSSLKRAPPANRLIAALPRADRQRVLTKCKAVELTYAEVLCEPGQRIEHVYFPTSGLISLLTPVDRPPGVEVGMVGREGVAGMPLFLGVNISSVRALVQGSGSALRMTAASFRGQTARSSGLRRELNRYLYSFIVQVSQTAACNSRHQLGPRLARWLLMTHDRAQSDRFYLTQEFLAQMLSVQRAGVTRAASLLQKKKLISYKRGHITVLDRRGLERAACACYRAVNKICGKLPH
ncbi:Crp/Fnr family transcriptional regulator [Sulfurifustis variabilis]|uniref:Crp/Fnr family transcriptional regulator n=1 Tax=Sulfurifustis variabilis TaxID=1675686 RepID=A0A1B4VF76_9GAMM|nr:Crp/Fnr family transcriptional regulator [Sulfurifustis variabilis]BAU49347.1 Crp/Fnr family transcriptional regulator [Sulfurifustis variabilis]